MYGKFAYNLNEQSFRNFQFNIRKFCSQKSIYQWNKVFVFTCAINIITGLLFFIFGDSTVQPWNYEDACDEEKREEKLLESKENGCPISIK